MPALLLLFCAGGCSSQNFKNMWKDVKGVYTGYFNTPAVLELDHDSYAEPHEIALSDAVSEVDYQLNRLLRSMDDSDRSPDEEWAGDMLRNFPWLSGILLTDGQGGILEVLAGDARRNFSLGALFIEDARQRRTDLRACALAGPERTELYLGKPVYVQDELRVMLIAYFDVLDLLRRAGKPEKFALSTAAVPLWSAYVLEETPLGDADWEELGESDVDGLIENNRGEFYWLSAYFANLRLFYSLPVAGNFSSNRLALEALKR
jgi:hypothetical protein